MNIIDTHQHLWELERFPYSWCAALPALHRSFSPADYAQAATEAERETGAHLVGTVHVEAAVDEPHSSDEVRWLHEVAQSGQSPILGVVAACRPERDDFAAQLEELRQFPLVKGMRRVLHTQPDELSQTPLFAENLRLLPDWNFSFDLCVRADQLPIAAALVEQCPDVSFILDHCGVPDIKVQALSPWRENIAAIALFPNVTCKISGIVAYADPENWTLEDLRPFVEHALTAFGPERVMWGSDWPVCTLAASYSQWLEATLHLAQQHSETDRRKLFHDNAARVYKLETALS